LFGDLPSADLVVALAKLKPKKTRVPRPPIDQPASVGVYISELKAAIEDRKVVLEVMGRLRADRSVQAPMARMIAQQVGVPGITSKTTKANAFAGIEALAAQRERDRFQADRIRKGA
jgi:hypothetical protein